MNIPLVKETQLNVEYSWKTLMCTLLTVLAILHIMQDVTERIVFLDSYVGYIPSLEKIFLSGSEKQPRFKWLTVIKTVLQNHHTVYSFLGASPSRPPTLTLRHQKPLTALCFVMYKCTCRFGMICNLKYIVCPNKTFLDSEWLEVYSVMEHVQILCSECIFLAYLVIYIVPNVYR